VASVLTPEDLAAEKWQGCVLELLSLAMLTGPRTCNYAPNGAFIAMKFLPGRAVDGRQPTAGHRGAPVLVWADTFAKAPRKSTLNVRQSG
jgi:hypothetical protein